MHDRLTRQYSITIYLIGVMIVASTGGVRADAINDEADYIYQSAYNLILDEKWTEAENAFNELIKNYPKSAWIDGAQFWKCYAQEKTRQSPEKSFESYQKFIKDFPESKWVNDAKQNLIRLAQELKKAGKPEYEAAINSLGSSADNDIALTALFALQSRGDEKAFDAVARIFDSAKDHKIRKKIVYVLGMFGTQKSTAKLIDIASHDTQSDIKQEAIFWLAQGNATPEVVDVIKKTIYDDPDHDVQKKAVFSLAQVKQNKGLPALIEIAKKHQNANIRKEAIFWIGQNDKAPEVITVLEDVALHDADPDVQKRAIFALSESAENGGVQSLLKLAKTHPNGPMRGEAIFWLSQKSETVETAGALRDFALRDNDIEVQKKALFALTQMPEDVGLPMLLAIAKSDANNQLREQAIFWLGQKATSEEMIRALEGFALKDSNEVIQKKALFALSQVKDGKGIPALINISKNHTNTKIRKEAIFWLGQSGDERAVKAIEEILDNK